MPPYAPPPLKSDANSRFPCSRQNVTTQLSLRAEPFSGRLIRNLSAYQWATCGFRALGHLSRCLPGRSGLICLESPLTRNVTVTPVFARHPPARAGRPILDAPAHTCPDFPAALFRVLIFPPFT